MARDWTHLIRESGSMRLAAIAMICGLFAADAALADSCPQMMD